MLQRFLIQFNSSDDGGQSINLSPGMFFLAE